MGYILDTDQIAYYAVQISISQASIHTFKGAVFLLTAVKKKKKLSGYCNLHAMQITPMA